MIQSASCLFLFFTSVLSYQSPPVQTKPDEFELSNEFLSQFLGPDFKDAVHYNFQQSDIINARTGNQFKESSSYKMHVPQLTPQQGQMPGNFLKVQVLNPGEIEAIERGMKKQMEMHQPAKSSNGVKSSNRRMVNEVHNYDQKPPLLNQQFRTFQPQFKQNHFQMAPAVMKNLQLPSEKGLRQPMQSPKEQIVKIQHRPNVQSSEKAEDRFIHLPVDKQASAPKRSSIERMPHFLSAKPTQSLDDKTSQKPSGNIQIQSSEKIAPGEPIYKPILPTSQEKDRRTFIEMQTPFGQQVPFEERKTLNEPPQPILYKIAQPPPIVNNLKISQERFMEFLRQRSLEKPANKLPSFEPPQQPKEQPIPSTLTMPPKQVSPIRMPPSEEMLKPLYEVIESSSKGPKMTYPQFDDKRSSNDHAQPQEARKPKPLPEKVVRQQRSFKTPAIENSSFEITPNLSEQSYSKDKIQLSDEMTKSSYKTTDPTFQQFPLLQENIQPAFENTQNFYATYFPFEERGFSNFPQQQIPKFAEETRSKENTQEALKPLTETNFESRMYQENPQKSANVPQQQSVNENNTEQNETIQNTSADTMQIQEQKGFLFRPIIYFFEKTDSYQNKPQTKS